jgi:hypothetical protein
VQTRESAAATNISTVKRGRNYLLDDETTQAMSDKDNRPIGVRVTPKRPQLAQQSPGISPDARNRVISIHVPVVPKRQDPHAW